MPTPRHRSIALAAVVAFTAAIVAAVAAAAGGAVTTAASWTRISGPTEPGVQLGLARGADGVLHVIWNRGTSATSIFETRISAAGRPAGTSTVASGFDGNGGLALLVMPDHTLRLFAAGAVQAGSSSYGINTYTAPAAGGAWSLQAGTFWGGALANSAAAIGATLTRDGQPVTSWRGFAAQGVPGVTPGGFGAGMTESLVATDAGGGGVVLSGVTNAGQGGLYVQQVLPSVGQAVVLPLPFGQNDWNTGVSGRLGAAGVYVAYADTRSAHLYRYGGGSRTLGRGQFTSATVCPAPEGRLWVAWGGSSSGLYVSRSSRAAGALEPVQKLKLPGAADGLTYVQCEGSSGPVDLFANVHAGTTSGFWQTHLLPQLSVRAAAARGKATISVRDAGDAVVGADVVVGGRHVRTGSAGTATVTARAGTYPVRVTAAGYAPAAARVTVR